MEPTPVSELALRLIEENKKTRASFLDLGNCGLTEVHIEVVNDQQHNRVWGWI
jgi:hypothetical protein